MQDPSAWVYESKTHDTKRHESERARRGYSVYDSWNFCDYIAWVNIQALEELKDGHGYPANLAGMEEWQELLDTMIKGFEACNTLASLEYDFNDKAATDALMAAKNKGFALYADYFMSLWD